MSDKRVYSFGDGKAEGSGKDKVLLGGKGAGLAEMTNLGLPVPPGFTITTAVCAQFYDSGERLPEGLKDEIASALARVEASVGAKFGDPDNPLLLSVRSGAAVSMPGMMDTILNLGLNDRVLEGLAKRTDDRRFAYDSYRRLVAMYGDVVLGLKPESAHAPDPFEVAISKKKRERDVELDNELDAEALSELVGEFKALIRELAPREFPDDPLEQLHEAVSAVFRSWNNPRAQTYRELNNISASLGTAVTVQAMVFGNLGADCGTGVAFTRDPGNGEPRFFGEYLVNAQGEDVVAGIRTPSPINTSGSPPDPEATLERRMPEVYRELDEVRRRLESHYRDMQDIEFTIQRGKLYLLQTRTGKRTAPAAVRIAVDMVHEKMIDEREAVRRIKPSQVDQLLHPMLDPEAARQVVCKGLPASPGAATGRVVFSAEDAEERGKRNERVILVRVETSPEDVSGMHHATGVLTARGGMTSHAAVVARGMGRPCVVGCGELVIDYANRTATARGYRIKEDDLLTIDGTSGEVMLGEVATVQASGSREFDELMGWVDRFRRLRVRTNADTPGDAEIARRFGAEGIGLCRTEHMFFEAERITAMREMILADGQSGRRAALAKIEPMQRADFEAIFKAMDGLPVTIRLLDPPLHEFLPADADIQGVAAALGRDPQSVRAKIAALHEFNPMLGLRGCRLGLAHPEIYEMQARAIITAAVEVAKRGVRVLPEIMIPLVASAEELVRLREVVDGVAQRVFKEQSMAVEYQVGTMIELPRAAILADRIAAHADFFSFGTNDLTQMTFGLSRDDSGRFLPAYVEDGVLPDDPFQVLDQDGVGVMIEWAVERGRRSKPKLKLGICGEHGGEPQSVGFCHRIGLDYVSCSPYRVPVARLAAAHAALSEER